MDMETCKEIQELQGKIQALETKINDIKATVMNFKSKLGKIDKIAQSADWNYKKLCEAFNRSMNSAFDNQKEFLAMMEAGFKYLGISTPEKWNEMVKKILLKGPTLMGIVEQVGLDKGKKKITR